MTKWPWYFIMDLGLWAITLVIVRWAWPRLDRYWKISVLITIGLVMILQVVNELVSLHIFKAWGFSEEYGSLLGWDIGGAPVEEYLFWFAYAWMIPFLYSGLIAQYKKREPSEKNEVSTVG
jgi:hypothetical protein